MFNNPSEIQPSIEVASINPKKYYAGRRCSICSHEEAVSINLLIKKGQSYRRIASQKLGSEKHYRSINRHARNCLNIEMNQFIEMDQLISIAGFFKILLKQFDCKNEAFSSQKFESVESEFENVKDLKGYLSTEQVKEITIKLVNIINKNVSDSSQRTAIMQEIETNIYQ